MPAKTVPNFAARTKSLDGCLRAAQRWLYKRGWSLTTIDIDGYKGAKKLLKFNTGSSFAILDIVYDTIDEQGYGAHSVVVRITNNDLTIVFDPAQAEIYQYPKRLYGTLHFITPLRCSSSKTINLFGYQR